MEDIIVGLLSMLLIVVVIPLYIWKRRQDAPDTHEHAEEAQVQQRECAVRATSARRMCRRPAVGASTSAAPAASMEDNDTLSDEDDVDDESHRGKFSKRKEKKQREREARQAAETARDYRQTKQECYEEIRTRKDEEREAHERLQEEEAKARQVKEEAEAALEFEKWRGEFSIDAEGTTENEVQDGSQGLLFNFVVYIQNHKCVSLEELSAEFKLRTQDCINRIISLEKMGRLSGVMDDRGKYIYIGQEEMKAVADYIKREGRVSISHLASKSNQFIDLEPKSQFEEGGQHKGRIQCCLTSWSLIEEKTPIILHFQCHESLMHI